MKEPALWWRFDPTIDRGRYVQHVLESYRRTPTCVGRIRREDRRLAQRLYDQQIPLPLLEAAFLLAASRRLHRPAEAPSLAPIRSLHYFLPLLDEIRGQAIDPGYISYVQWKLSRADQVTKRT